MHNCIIVYRDREGVETTETFADPYIVADADGNVWDVMRARKGEVTWCGTPIMSALQVCTMQQIRQLYVLNGGRFD